MNKIRAFFFLAVLWITLSGTNAYAYFCGDPLSDNCSLPRTSKPSTQTSVGSVRSENHPLSTFILVPDQSLKENFESWGNASGWKVIWKSEYTFPVKARYTAGRTFLGAIRRSVRIFNRSSGGWLKVHAFMANHVLLVEDGR